MSEQKKNKLDVWFSYAGAQKEFVKSVIDELNKDEVVKKACTQTEGVKGDGSIQPEIIAKHYITYHPQTDSPNFTLTASEAIAKLVRMIGGHFLKVIVLSKEYFDSFVCLSELYASLLSEHTEQGFLPAVILYDLEPSELFSGDERFGFRVTNDRAPITKKRTLQKALRKVHKSLHQTSHWLTRDYPQEAANFDKKLDELSSSVLIVHKSSSNKSKDVAVEVVRHVFKRSASFSTDVLTPRIKKLLDQWMNSEFGTAFAQKFAQSNAQKCIETAVTEVTNVPALIRFIKALEGTINAHHGQLTRFHKAKEQLLELCITGLLNVINRLDASVLDYMGDLKGILNIALRKELQEGSEGALESLVTFSVSSGQIPKSRLDNSHQITFDSVVFSLQPAIDPASSEEVLHILKSIHRQLCKTECIANTLDEFIGHSDYVDDIRAELESFYDCPKDDVASLMKLPSVLLVLKDVTNTSGFYSMLEAVEKIINPEHPDEPFLKIPTLVVRENRDLKDEPSYSVLLTSKESRQVIRHINQLIEKF